MTLTARLVIAGATMATVMPLWYLVRETRLQAEIQRAAQIELLELRATLSPDTTHADLKAHVDRTRHLFLVDGGRFVMVDSFSPSPFASSRSTLFMEFRNDQLCNARLNMDTNTDGRESGRPDDLTFSCDALPNNALQRTKPAQAMELRR